MVDIQTAVDRMVRDNMPVGVATMPRADADLLSDVVKMADDIYPGTVRLVSVGHQQSRELCGGT